MQSCWSPMGSNINENISPILTKKCSLEMYWAQHSWLVANFLVGVIYFGHNKFLILFEKFEI